MGLRIREGVWIIGFHGTVDTCSVLTAELWAIREGLNIV